MPFTPIEDGDISKATNRFTSATGTVYDEAGQVVTDGKFRNMSFAYDANGRQVKATKTNVPDALTVYDALGNRVATKIYDVWQYVIYDAFGKLVAEYGIASEGLGGVKYIQQDWQGSVRAITNNSGFVVARTDHQAFGEEIGLGIGLRSIEQGYSADKTTRQGYGLTENDESSGQQHTQWRKLETQAGRWTRPDPYKGSMSIGNPQSFNRYSYVTNDPLNFVDPSGLDDGVDDDGVIRVYIDDSYLQALLWLYFGGGGGGFFYQPVGGVGDPPGVGGLVTPTPQDACAPSFQLPDGGEGYVRKAGTTHDSQFGRRGIIDKLKSLAESWARNNPIRIGDISYDSKGSRTSPNHPDHSEHELGYQVDIGLFWKDGGNKQGLTFNSSEYDRPTTQALVDILTSDPNVTRIRFNDPNVKSSKIVRDKKGKVHDNHLHVEYSGC